MDKKLLRLAILELCPRIIALATLWKTIVGGIGALVTLFSASPYSLMSLEHIESLLHVAYVATGLGSIVTASPALYATTMFLRMLASTRSLCVGSLIISVVGLVSLLFFDVIRSTYRGNQITRYELSRTSVVLYIVVTIILVTLCILPSRAVSGWVYLLLNSFSTSNNNVLAMMGENIVFRVIVSIVMVVVIVLMMSNLFETIALLLRPSRTISLSALSSRHGIFVLFEEPLKGLKILILASLLAPPLYALLQYGVLPLACMYFTELYGYVRNSFAKLALEVAMFILSMIIVRKYLSKVSFDPVKASHVVIGLAASIYAVGVALSYINTGNLVFSLAHPSLSALGNAMARVYIGFYVEFIYLIEDLARALGVAP